MSSSDSPIKKIILVGHCGFDAFSLKQAAEHWSKELAEQVPVVTAEDDATLQQHISGESLLLVNRVLGGHFQDSEGVALIEKLNAGETKAPAMLVSNYDDAQEQAVRAGAMPGFGKAKLRDPATTQRMKDLLAGARQPG